MLQEIRNELKRVAAISDLQTRAEELDSCLIWISELVEDEELDGRTLKIICNSQKTYLKEFLKALSSYGNSGYAEVAPVVDLVLGHAKIFSELEKDHPGIIKKARPFFHCIQ